MKFKRLALISIALLLAFGGNAKANVGVKFDRVLVNQWLGVGTSVDTTLFQTYVAVLNGIVKTNAVVVGNNTRAIEGLIRYDGAHFWGYTPQGWIQLDGGSGSGGGGGGGVTTFLGLTDTPSSYSGNANKLVRVNSTEDNLEFISPSSITTNANSINGIGVQSGTPTNGYVLKYNSSTGQIEWAVDQTGTGGGASSFIDLDDTPSDYGNPNEALITDGQGAIEYTPFKFTGLTDTPSTYDNGYLLISGTSSINYTLPDALVTKAGWVRSKPITLLPPSDGYVLKYDAASDSVKWATDNTGSGTGATTLVGLDDTPTGYGASSDYFLATNSAKNGTEWKAVVGDTDVVWAKKYSTIADAISAAYQKRRPLVISGVVDLNGSSIEVNKDSLNIILAGAFIKNTGTRVDAFYITSSYVNISGNGIITGGASYSINRGIYVDGGEFEQINASLRIRDTYGSGMYLLNGKDSFVSNIQFLNCGRDGASSTLVVYTSDNCHFSNIYSVWGQSTANHGDFQIVQSDNVDFVNSKISAPQGYGLEVSSNTYGFRWIGGEIGGAYKHGVVILNSRFSTIDGAVIHLNSNNNQNVYDNVRLDKSNHITITGCKIFSQHDANGDPSTWTKYAKNGISVIDTSEYINITGNSINNHVTNGIYVDTGSNHVEILNNEIDGSPTGINLGAGASYCRTIENRLHDNTTDYSNSGSNNKHGDITLAGDNISLFNNDAGYASAFTGLSDTPADYSNAANKRVVVNASGDALEFQANSLYNLTDVTTSGLSGGHFLTYNGSYWVNQYGIKKSNLVDSGTLPFTWSSSELASNVMLEGENVSLLNNDAGYVTQDDIKPIVIQANIINPDSLELENNDVMVWQNYTGANVVVDSVVFKATRNSGYTATLWFGDRFSTSSGKTTITQATITAASGDGMYYSVKSGTDIQNSTISANKQIWVTCDDSVDLGQLFIIVYMRKQ